MVLKPLDLETTEHDNTISFPAPPSRAPQPKELSGLLAPWWHTALLVLIVLTLSVAGVKQLRNFGDRPLHLVLNYTLTIVYEWILAAIVVWGLHRRGVPLRQILGERRPGLRAWLVGAGGGRRHWA